MIFVQVRLTCETRDMMHKIGMTPYLRMESEKINYKK